MVQSLNKKSVGFFEKTALSFFSLRERISMYSVITCLKLVFYCWVVLDGV